MHILHVTHVLSFGGAQNILVGLAEEAVRRGHRASVLTLCPGNDYGERLRAHAVAFRTLAYRGRFTPTNTVRLVQLRRSLVRAVEQMGPDIIHEHLFGPKILLYGMASVAKRPVVQTQHDNSPWWGNSGWYMRLQTHVESIFARKSARFTVAISQSVQRGVLTHLGVPEDQCPVIYNFMEEPSEHVVHVGRKPDSYNVFVVARLVMEKKGLDTAIRVITQVRKDLPAVRLVVVGAGPDEEDMREMVKRKGMAEVIEFRGYQSDVYAQYKEADVVLMPSRWEGFGIAAAEAAAAGVPVVASRIGGLQEVVEHGQTGLTCAPEDVECFSKALTKLLTDDALYNRLSSDAALRARERFSRERAFEAYEKLYQRVLKAPLPVATSEA